MIKVFSYMPPLRDSPRHNGVTGGATT